MRESKLSLLLDVAVYAACGAAVVLVALAMVGMVLR